jgi:2-iminobutanoate/2-iminopropanoate deaminase
MPQKQAVVLPNIDPPRSPYSAGIVCGDLVFVSGQGPIDPKTKQIIGATIEQQTEITLQNVERVLQTAGCSLNDAVKSTVHLLHIEDFDRFNEVYRKFFKEPFPTRTTVQSVLWGGILVEIDVIAVKGASKA